MPIPRFRIRTLMIAVAVVGLIGAELDALSRLVISTPEIPAFHSEIDAIWMAILIPAAAVSLGGAFIVWKVWCRATRRH